MCICLSLSLYMYIYIYVYSIIGGGFAGGHTIDMSID